jgi:hypothetical protein
VSDDDLHIPVGAGGWTYVWDHPRKPHAHPVAAPSGVVLTQVEPEDHPWQRGLWFVVKYVDGDNFWEELPRSWDPAGYGVQRHVGPPRREGDTIVGDLEWIRPDGTTVAMREHREIRTVPLDDDAYALDWDVTLQPPSDAMLDRTPHDGTWGGYSGLAFRGRADWTDTRLLLDDDRSVDRVAPQRSRWCDLSSGAAGVCILDHPANAGHPVDWYASCRAGDGYGEGWANTVYPAFLWHGPRRLIADEPLRLRYRVVVHDGAWTHARADAAWAAYAG